MDIQEWRSNICQSLIAAGKTVASEIINEVSALETFVFGAQKTITLHIVEAEKTSIKRALSDEKTVATTAPAETTVATAEAESIPADTTVALPTAAEIKTALMAVAKKSREALQGILDTFNVVKVSEIQEADFPRVMQLAEAALENANG